MTHSEAKDFPFVQDLPVRQKSRIMKIWEYFAECRKIVELHGMIVPVKLAADIAGVSRQRIHDLLDQGKLEKVIMHDHVYVTETSFVAWAKSERKTGRPLKLPKTVKEKWKAGSGWVGARGPTVRNSVK